MIPGLDFFWCLEDVFAYAKQYGLGQGAVGAKRKAIAMKKDYSMPDLSLEMCLLELAMLPQKQLFPGSEESQMLNQLMFATGW